MMLALAPEGFEQELGNELKFLNLKIENRWERLFLINNPEGKTLSWTEVIAPQSQTINFTSIKDAAQKLKNIHSVWSSYNVANFRRAALIEEQLRSPKSKAIQFRQEINWPAIGLWSLVDKDTIIYSAQTNSLFPLGKIVFTEDKSAPSRAYLKLWEALTCHNFAPPDASDTVIDLGSSPGGWTWVLTSLGCKVKSFDRAELRQDLMSNPLVEHRTTDAFAIKPEDYRNATWLFSDLICYPSKLYELVEKWRLALPNLNFVCTIKFQGETDFSSIEKFKKIPGSRIVHLHHNKHELTFILVR